ncbi:hypothetical protein CAUPRSCDRAFT_7752, partial [Caulochytrium protostelioides]
PLAAVMGAFICGVTWYGFRLARGPDVVWSRKTNPYPWLSIQPNMTTKIYDPHGDFEKSWSR